MYNTFFGETGVIDLRPLPLEGRVDLFDCFSSLVGVGELSQISASTTFFTSTFVGIGVAERSIVITLLSLPFMSKALVGF
jgi:hypothetical protein